MKLITYDPKLHKDRQLYERYSVMENGFIVTRHRMANVTHDLAAQTPWFYRVEDDDAS